MIREVRGRSFGFVYAHGVQCPVVDMLPEGCAALSGKGALGSLDSSKTDGCDQWTTLVKSVHRIAIMGSARGNNTQKGETDQRRPDSTGLCCPFLIMGLVFLKRYP